nr:MAG TPA: hypothetical protein [Caudoviricetes sp.]
MSLCSDGTRFRYVLKSVIRNYLDIGYIAVRYFIKSDSDI